MQTSPQPAEVNPLARSEKVGIFFPKRLAWRLVGYVDLHLGSWEQHPPHSDDEWIHKECLIELQKALARAGYASARLADIDGYARPLA